MSYYTDYGYADTYAGYGYEEPATDLMIEDDEAVAPAVMAYAFLVPILDGVNWYVTDDKWGDASNSDWDNAIMAMLGGAAYKSLIVAAHFAMGDAVDMLFMLGAGISIVQEAAVLYLINNAEGSAASDNNSTNIGYALAATNLLVSAGAFMGMMGKDGDEEEEYGDEAAADDDYGYGYNEYSYYY